MASLQFTSALRMWLPSLAGPQGLGISPDLFFGSLGNQFHPSIRQIANVSRHFISASNFARGIPKSNPLYSPCVKDRHAFDHTLRQSDYRQTANQSRERLNYCRFGTDPQRRQSALPIHSKRLHFGVHRVYNQRDHPGRSAMSLFGGMFGGGQKHPNLEQLSQSIHNNLGLQIGPPGEDVHGRDRRHDRP